MRRGSRRAEHGPDVAQHLPPAATAGYTRNMNLRRLLVIAAVAIVLAACGNKGPLTLNQKADEPPVPAAPAAPADGTATPAPAADTPAAPATPPR